MFTGGLYRECSPLFMQYFHSCEEADAMYCNEDKLSCEDGPFDWLGTVLYLVLGVTIGILWLV